MLTSRKDLSTAVHSVATTPADNTGSPSLRHASCTTQAEGAWSRVSSVRLGLCRMQAMRWQATATEMLLPRCETRSETERTKKSTAEEAKTKSKQQQTQQIANSAGAKYKTSSHKGKLPQAAHISLKSGVTWTAAADCA